MFSAIARTMISNVTDQKPGKPGLSTAGIAQSEEPGARGRIRMAEDVPPQDGPAVSSAWLAEQITEASAAGIAEIGRAHV